MSIAFVSVTDVRNYIDLNASTTPGSSMYSNDQVQSNIWAASEFLEKATNRYFANRTGLTLTLTTNGDGAISLPGIRAIGGAVTKGGAALVANTSYYLLPDDQQTGVFTGMSFRAFSSRDGGPAYLHNSEWFDRNYDSPRYNYGGYGGSLPNDLVLTNVSVGYEDATFPEAARHAAKVLAAFYTKRPDALLSGASFGPDGTAFDLSRLPMEVSGFIAAWRIGDQLAVSL